MAEARAVLGDEGIAAAWSSGEMMTLEVAITYALEEDGRGGDEIGLGA